MTALTDFEDRPFGCPPDRISRGEARKLMAQQKRQRSKYGVDCSPEGKAERTRQVNGKAVLFHSKAEAKHYDILLLLEKQGKIRNLELQPTFVRRSRRNSKRVLWKYRADFAYFKGQERIIEDVKGKVTPEYRLKKIEIEDEYYPLKIREIKAR